MPVMVVQRLVFEDNSLKAMIEDPWHVLIVWLSTCDLDLAPP